MRYYQIFISTDDGELVKSWISYGGNSTIPGALNVVLDFPTYNYAAPQGACALQIWGIGLDDIKQASNFNNLIIQVYGGMQKGLPLANPKQNGLLLSGRIFQCFGNWQGTEQNLNFVIYPGGDLGSPNAPANLCLNWRAGTELSVAVDQALAAAFPLLRRLVSATPGLVRADDRVTFYNSVQELATYVKQASIAIKGAPYQGLDITVVDNRFLIYDEGSTVNGISEANPKQIAFIDLIGQPTWYGFAQVSFKCVMRADLSMGDFVQMPPAQYTTQAQSYSQFRNKSGFQGTFRVNTVRHIGNFRQSDGNSWVTVIEGLDLHP